MPANSLIMTQRRRVKQACQNHGSKTALWPNLRLREAEWLLDPKGGWPVLHAHGGEAVLALFARSRRDGSPDMPKPIRSTGAAVDAFLALPRDAQQAIADEFTVGEVEANGGAEFDCRDAGEAGDAPEFDGASDGESSDGESDGADGEGEGEGESESESDGESGEGEGEGDGESESESDDLPQPPPMPEDEADTESESESDDGAELPAPPPIPDGDLNVFERAERMIRDAVRRGVISNPHRQLVECLACVLAHGRLYMAGPSGTGKSYAAEQIAQILGREFVLQGYDGSMFPERIHGFTDANGKFQPGPLTKAYASAAVYCGDEMDKADTTATSSCNQHVNFNPRIRVGNEDLLKHDDFVFIATGNSAMDGPGGADGEYATEKQSADFVARWEQLGVMVHFDYDPEVESNILGKYAHEHPILAEARKNLRDECIDGSRTIQTRTMQGWTTWRSNGLSVGETVGRICRLWSSTEVRKAWKHLPSRELDKAVSMLGQW